MTAQEAKELKKLGKTVGFTIGTDPKGVIELLRKNNIDVPENATRKEIISLVIENGLKKQAFLKDFTKLTNVLLAVGVKMSNKNRHSNFTEGDEIMERQYASADGSFDWGGLAGGLVSSGSSIFTTIKTTESQEKLAKAQAEISANETAAAIALGQNQLEIEKLKLEQLKTVNTQSPSNKNNTMLYVGFGVLGLLLVVGMVFLIKKK